MSAKFRTVLLVFRYAIASNHFHYVYTAPKCGGRMTHTHTHTSVWFGIRPTNGCELIALMCRRGGVGRPLYLNQWVNQGVAPTRKSGRLTQVFVCVCLGWDEIKRSIEGFVNKAIKPSGVECRRTGMAHSGLITCSNVSHQWPGNGKRATHLNNATCW